MNQIMLLLGLNSSGFKAGLKSATDQTNAFERSWKGIGKIFAAGGITTLALGFLRSVVEHARESKDALDENTQAVLRFGNSWDQAKSTFMTGAVQGLGWIADKVEKATIGFGGLIYGAEAAAAALDQIEAAPALAAAAAAAEKLAAAEESLAKGRRDRAMAEADGYGKLVILINEEIELKEKVRDLDKDKPAQLAAINALEAKTAEIKRTALQVTKDEGAAAEKIEAERKKANADRMKVVEENRELMILEAKLLAGTINPEENKRLEILRLQAKQKIITAELDKLLAKDVAGTLTPAEKVRLNVLIRQNDTIQGQIDGLQKVNEKVTETSELIASNIREWEKFKLAITNTGRSDKDISPRELERKRKELEADIFRRQLASNASPATSGGFTGYDPILQQQRMNLQRLLGEITLRNDVRRVASTQGEDAAFNKFSGLTESRFREILGEQTVGQATVDELKSIKNQFERGIEVVLRNPGS